MNSNESERWSRRCRGWAPQKPGDRFSLCDEMLVRWGRCSDTPTVDAGFENPPTPVRRPTHESVGRCRRAKSLLLVVGIVVPPDCDVNVIEFAEVLGESHPHSVYNATFSFNNLDALSLTLSIYQRSFLHTDGLYGTLG